MNHNDYLRRPKLNFILYEFGTFVLSRDVNIFAKHLDQIEDMLTDENIVDDVKITTVAEFFQKIMSIYHPHTISGTLVNPFNQTPFNAAIPLILTYNNRFREIFKTIFRKVKVETIRSILQDISIHDTLLKMIQVDDFRDLTANPPVVAGDIRMYLFIQDLLNDLRKIIHESNMVNVSMLGEAMPPEITEHIADYVRGESRQNKPPYGTTIQEVRAAHAKRQVNIDARNEMYQRQLERRNEEARLAEERNEAEREAERERILRQQLQRAHERYEGNIQGRLATIDGDNEQNINPSETKKHKGGQRPTSCNQRLLKKNLFF